MSTSAVANAAVVASARNLASSTSNAALGSSTVRFSPVARRSGGGSAIVRASAGSSPEVSART